jgi:hypothetical protein
VNSQIKITVGDGSIVDLNPEQVLDPALMDSIDEANYKDAQETYEQEMKEAQARAEQERRNQSAQENKDNKDKKKEQDKKSDKDKDKKKN